jgi:large subunit ribosomal protein L25
MEKLALASSLRDLSVKTSAIRAAKLVPAVVYGHSLDPVHVTVSNSDFLRAFRKGGHTHLVELAIDGKKHTVLIHEVQKHPVTGAFLHIDFFAVSAKEKIHVAIPVHLTGKSQAVVEGGVLEQNLHQIDVKVLPADLVDAIEVDVAPIEKIGDAIHVSDIAGNYPKLEILTPAGDSIVAAHAPKVIVEEAPVAEVPAEGEAAAPAEGEAEAKAE